MSKQFCLVMIKWFPLYGIIFTKLNSKLGSSKPLMFVSPRRSQECDFKSNVQTTFLESIKNT